MIQVSGANEKLQIVTSSATATLDVQVDFANWDLATGAPTVTSPKNQCTTIAGAATTDVLAAPGANISSRVKALFVVNTHATLSQTFNVQRILAGPTTFKFKTITLQANEMALMNEHGVWFVYDASGAVKGTNAGPVDVQIFTAPGANTWTKPTSFTPKIVIVKAWAGGGGGGAGASLATAVVAHGGAGGGGGAFMRESYNAADLGVTEPVTIGAGGTAGAPGVAGAAGGDGGTGGDTSFGTKLKVFGGGGGRGGAISAAAGGGGGGGGTGSAGAVGTTIGGIPGAPYPNGVAPTTTQNSSAGTGGVGTIAVPTTTQNCAEYGGAGGCGAAATPVAAGIGASSIFGGGGGGQGGSHSAVPAVIAGGAGGSSGLYTVGGGGAVGADGAAPTPGTAGADGDSTKGGGGGGGGGTTVTAATAGRAGGNGGRGGGGGGGGGVGQNPGLGGAGGVGGNGYVIVITW